MNDNDKRDFKAMFDSLTQMPLAKAPESFTKDMARMYWETLRHRAIDEVREALSAHLRDPQRGRFYPTPADVEAKLPSSDEAWPTGDEAWAMMPKDEASSAATCDEMVAAYVVAYDLIEMGDMIAARRAFIDAYERRVTQAKREGRQPEWFASLGSDADGRDKARIEAAAGNGQVLQLENYQSPSVAALEHCADNASPESRESAKAAIIDLKNFLGMR